MAFGVYFLTTENWLLGIAMIAGTKVLVVGGSFSRHSSRAWWRRL
jgi:hypothetical protein